MHKTISIYFSGTGFEIDNWSCLAGNLYNQTETSEQQLKMGFNGCGVDYGFNGNIFGSGLDEQCNKAIKQVTEELNAGHQITLNVYGHSRGGIAALMLAQQLSQVDPKQLAINLALLDPVPGNLITTSSLDPFNISLTNKTMDLSACKPLKKVLALYPHYALSSIAAHAPLFVTYPPEIELEQDAIAGYHADAEFITRNRAKELQKAGFIEGYGPNQVSTPLMTLSTGQMRIHEFLIKNGTNLFTSSDYAEKRQETLKQIYLCKYQKELADIKGPTTKSGHSATGIYINTKTGAQYFNKHHARLAGAGNEASLALTFEQSNGPISLLKRFSIAYPLTSNIIKWTVLSLAISCLLFFTGGLAAMPFVAAVIAKLGAASIVAVAPIVAGTLTSLWYAVIKPAGLWAANRLFYPLYALRHFTANSEKALAKDSTAQVLDALVDPALPSPAVQPQALDRPYHGPDLFNAGSSSPGSASIPQALNNLPAL